MKTIILIMSLMALGLMGVGCSKSNTQANPTGNTGQAIVPPVVVDPNPLNPGGSSGTPTFYGGDTQTFAPISLSTMNAYVATHPLNNPTNYRININLAQASAGRYGGTVTISYLDNGIQYDGVFRAGMGSNQSFKGMYDNGTLEANYNYWFNFNNQLVFTAYFEDEYGAITLTLTPETTTATPGNDAEPFGNTKYKGQIYFKNFCYERNSDGSCKQTTFATHSPYRHCWFTYTGPYDCRSNVISTKCGLTPGGEAGYQLLGSFSGVDIKKAFNIQ